MDSKQTNFDFGDPAKEVEDIMKRKVSYMANNPLARTLQESRLMGSASPAGQGSIPGARNSPSSASAVRTQSPSFRHSPKLEQELLELGNFPPSPQYHTPTSSLTRQGTLYSASRTAGNNHKL